MSDHADVTVPKFQVNSAAMGISAVVGLAGLAATGFAIAQDAHRGMLSYLLGFAYWLTLAMGSLIMILSFRAAGARWVIGVRRIIEVFATGIVVSAVLSLPILAMVKSLYPWATNPAKAEGMNDPTFFKNIWLSTGFFTGRIVVVFVLCVIAAELLLRWSKGLNSSPSADLVKYQIRLGSGGMPIIFLGGSFLVFDLLMSLEPGWGSTMFAAYVLVGGYLGSMAMTIIVTHRVNRPGQLLGYVTPTHLHNMGKLMFAAVCFWTYVSVSQYLLMWIANLPEEVPWFIERMNGAWRPIFFSLIFLHFIVPFLLLLPKAAKTNPQYVSGMAAFLMVMHFVDLSWIILPAQRGNWYTWSDFTAVIGVGGIHIAYLIFRLRDQQVAPRGDPDFAVHAALPAAH